MAPSQQARDRVSARGFSLVEVIVCIGIVGIMMVAALNTVAMAKQSQRIMGDRARGQLLAVDLMSEILTLPYEDPEDTDVSFGPGADESTTSDRSLFDDVDDYNGWSATPPQRKDGTTLTDLTGWQRSVSVSWINPNTLTQTKMLETGAKRVTVTVQRGPREVATLVAVCTSTAGTSFRHKLQLEVDLVLE
jgi:prepilin-type N-terminal cleavage/methylation domain-containing protein